MIRRAASCGSPYRLCCRFTSYSILPHTPCVLTVDDSLIAFSHSRVLLYNGHRKHIMSGIRYDAITPYLLVFFKVIARTALFLSSRVTLMRGFPLFVGFLMVLPIFASLIALSSVIGMLSSIGMPSCRERDPFFIATFRIHFFAMFSLPPFC